MLFRLSWIAELLGTSLVAEDAARALTDRGLTVDAVELDGDDATLDVDIPANRPDCLGHLGLARELAAAHGRALPEPERSTAKEGLPFDVAIEAPDGCGRFTARIVRGVRVGPSPAHVVARLEACGLRSVNNVVDASNLVMLELGNPIHFFDLARLPEPRLTIRRAAPGECFAPLDGEVRELVAEDLVVADSEGPAALAGVIGGSRTGIGDETTDVLVEVAWFEPLGVRRSARRHGFHTDASHRFERGVDPEGPAAAQALAVRLLTELAGGRADEAMIDHYPAARDCAELTLEHDSIDRLLGYRPDDARIVEALDALGLAPRSNAAGSSTIVVPSWRVDLEHEADLVEEVARHIGYDAIPEDSISVLGIPATLDREGQAYRLEALGERARDRLAAAGFHEAYGYAMIGAEEDRGWSPEEGGSAALTNPMAETMSTLRRSLLPGLLRAIDRNLRRGVRDARLFEVGRAFVDRGEALPHEPLRVAALWTGAARPRHWRAESEAVDWLDLAGLGEALVESLAPGLPCRRQEGAPEAFHPGRAGLWIDADGRTLGWFGMLHPARQGDLPQSVGAFEIDLSVLARAAPGRPSYRKLPRLGGLSRDLAVVIPETVRYARVAEVLEAVEAPAPATFEVVDRYVGEPLEPGQASVTVRATLAPYERSLTEETIESYREALIRALDDELGLSVRG